MMTDDVSQRYTLTFEGEMRQELLDIADMIESRGGARPKMSAIVVAAIRAYRRWLDGEATKPKRRGDESNN